MERPVGRKALPHEIPTWLGDSDHQTYFITICSGRRTATPLIEGDIPHRLLASVRFYYEAQKWWIELALIMPDHIHLLACFPKDMPPVVNAWKRWTATNLQILWQRDFFDHRLRNDEKWSESAEYILQNPVRAGLVKDWRVWPHFWLSQDRDPLSGDQLGRDGSSSRP